MNSILQIKVGYLIDTTTISKNWLDNSYNLIKIYRGCDSIIGRPGELLLAKKKHVSDKRKIYDRLIKYILVV